MKTKSFRFRLTIWYTVVFLVTIGIIFASFYWVTRRAILDRIDSDITVGTRKIVELVTRVAGDREQIVVNQFLSNEIGSIPGTEVVVFDGLGIIVSSSLIVSPTDKVFYDMYENALGVQKPFFYNEKIHDSLLRFLVTPVRQNSRVMGVVIVGQPIGEVQDSLDTLVLMLGIVFLVLVVPTIFGVYLLTYRAIQPVTVMSRKLKKISSENLGERIGDPGTGDEIAELAQTFNGLLDRLSAAFSRERQFISDVAHELKTPLATMRSGIEVALLKERGKEEYKKALLESLVDINRLSTTLKNVLDLAWSEADNAKMEKEVFNLSEMMEELKDTAVKMVYGKPVVIQGTIEKNILTVGKKDRLFRSLLNIIGNAVKYTRKGKIIISLRIVGKETVIKVKDTGIGILEKDLAHVTERFYRGGGVERTAGSGLGLAIASAIIASHHGRMKISSKLGKGTLVEISLPVMKILS